MAHETELMRDFFETMNCRSNARYRELSDTKILGCEMWVYGMLPRGRIIAWESNEKRSESAGVQWEKVLSIAGPFEDCRVLYEDVSSITDLRRRVEDESSVEQPSLPSKT